MQADIFLPLFGLGPHNFAVHNDVHVVFPLSMPASPAQIRSAHERLAENFGRFCHVLFTADVYLRGSLRENPNSRVEFAALFNNLSEAIGENAQRRASTWATLDYFLTTSISRSILT